MRECVTNMYNAQELQQRNTNTLICGRSLSSTASATRVSQEFSRRLLVFLRHNGLEPCVLERLHIESFVHGTAYDGLDESRTRRQVILQTAHKRVMTTELQMEPSTQSVSRASCCRFHNTNERRRERRRENERVRGREILQTIASRMPFPPPV